MGKNSIKNVIKVLILFENNKIMPRCPAKRKKTPAESNRINVKSVRYSMEREFKVIRIIKSDLSA